VVAVACQAVWLTHLLADKIRGECSAPELKVDNQLAIALCKNLVFHDRSKHINVCYHYIQECIDEGSIVVSYTATAEQLADLLTKAVGRTPGAVRQDQREGCW
jgi:hypothetical protein